MCASRWQLILRPVIGREPPIVGSGTVDTRVTHFASRDSVADHTPVCANSSAECAKISAVRASRRRTHVTIKTTLESIAELGRVNELSPKREGFDARSRHNGVVLSIA
jgi:hypothetical protein